MNSNRPLTAPEVRSMFAAIDKADADRLERQIEREQRAPRLDAWHVDCSRCKRGFSSSTDYHTHVAQGCK